jgi:hypothetical protein
VEGVALRREELNRESRIANRSIPESSNTKKARMGFTMRDSRRAIRGFEDQRFGIRD